MSARKVATYDEALEILSNLARAGDVRAAVALAGHLRKEGSADVDDKDKAKIVELAGRRTG